MSARQTVVSQALAHKQAGKKKGKPVPAYFAAALAARRKSKSSDREPYSPENQ